MRAAFFFLLLLTACASAPERTPRHPDTLADSVVTVYVHDDHDRRAGSGTAFAISKHFLLTAAHVCDGSKVLYFDDPRIERANVIYSDNGTDTCLLSAEHRLVPLKISYQPMRRGDHVYVYGSPSGIAHMLTEGWAGDVMSVDVGPYSGRRRALSAPAWGGNSGGPVLNDRFEVVGILVAGSRAYPHITFSATYDAVARFRP